MGQSFPPLSLLLDCDWDKYRMHTLCQRFRIFSLNFYCVWAHGWRFPRSAVTATFDVRRQEHIDSSVGLPHVSYWFWSRSWATTGW